MQYARVPQIGIIMSSEKDLPQMEQCACTLRSLGIPFEMTALSPYRTPDQVRDYGMTAEQRGYEVILAGSGGTNELACMVASYTCLPVVGIPLRSAGDNSVSKEFAALLSTLETPPGVPVATVGFNDVENAAMLAAQILGVKDRRVRRLLEAYRQDMRQKAQERATRVEARGRELQSEDEPILRAGKVEGARRR
ncbi:MAG TPA: AIR carboxylase family protein [Armatimonadota bacterium]|nr:AIR carboxylase family protein [Armatimonadota bacterium]